MNTKWKSVLASLVLALGLVCATPAMAAKLININTATVPQLEQVKGIGEALAERIVEYRKEHGPFKSLDGLVQVKGIGEKSLDHLRGFLTAGKMK